MSDNIQRAYRESKDIYDAVLTQQTFFSKLYIRLFWQNVDDREIAAKVLGMIPDQFAGDLLDVPVGTAVFTEQKWRELNRAHIVCLDYSEEMLARARRRLRDLKHITFVQGDVGALPFSDQSFDIVVSMNGFHAFPDKTKAYEETRRVLKPGGFMIGCCYIRGESRITDSLVNFVLAKKGWFTPPFDTAKGLEKRLGDLYSAVVFKREGSMAYFKCES